MVETAARVQANPTGAVYARRQPEKTSLYRVVQENLLTFEQQWTDEASRPHVAEVRDRRADIAKKILVAMHLPTEVPELHPARPPPGCGREGQDAEEWVN